MFNSMIRLVNPWRECRRLRAENVELSMSNRDYVKANRKLAEWARDTMSMIQSEKAQSFLLGTEIERLSALLAKAGVEDPNRSPLVSHEVH